MAVIVNIQFEIVAGKREEALGIINPNLPDTRSYEGCHWVHLVTPIDDENRVEALSMWDSKEAYEQYFQWRIDSGAFEEIVPLMVGDPVLLPGRRATRLELLHRGRAPAGAAADDGAIVRAGAGNLHHALCHRRRRTLRIRLRRNCGTGSTRGAPR